MEKETIIEGIKLFMAFLAMGAIYFLLIKNMRRCAEVLEKEEEIKKLKGQYSELYDNMVVDISKLERKLRDNKISYENKIDKLEEVIKNLEKNK